MGYVTVTLDTTPPDVAVEIADGDTTTLTADVTAAVTTSATDVLQIKVWGDVDPAFDPNVQPLEVDAAWVSYSAVLAVRLQHGTGVRRLSVRLRDDVANESAEASDQIDLGVGGAGIPEPAGRDAYAHGLSATGIRG
jgi:hypothetical protein